MTAKKGKSKNFKKHWKAIKKVIVKRDSEANPEKKERLELRIHSQRTSYLKKKGPDRTKGC